MIHSTKCNVLIYELKINLNLIHEVSSGDLTDLDYKIIKNYNEEIGKFPRI
jgi:hypothetical protein